MKKIIKNIAFILIPLISISLTLFFLMNSIKMLYFSGYCILLNNRTIIKYFSACPQGVNDSADSLYFSLETNIIFIVYLLCLINLYFFRKHLRNLRDSKNT